MLRSVIGGDDTVFLRQQRWVARTVVSVATLVGSGGCEPVDGPTPLEQRAGLASEVAPGRSSTETQPPAPGSNAAQDSRRPASESRPTTPRSETQPPAPTPPAAAPPSNAERVTLALALDPSLEVRASVVGLVAFPMTDKPTGYAREEQMRLSDCDGDGIARRCTLTHRFLGFEAEPPAGRFLEGDYQRVAHLQSRHPITALGHAPATAIVTVAEDAAAGAPALDDALAASLADVHRLFCIRFPGEAVGIGAKWSDTCTTVTAGMPGRRTVAWELSALLDGEPGGSRRAELTYAGQYVQTLVEDGRQVERTGTVQGKLYFFVDAGQPHLMREKLAVPLGRTGVVTETTINVQFARVDPDDPTIRLRTDGTPFPERPPVAAAPP